MANVRSALWRLHVAVWLGPFRGCCGDHACQPKSHQGSRTPSVSSKLLKEEMAEGGSLPLCPCGLCGPIEWPLLVTTEYEVPFWVNSLSYSSAGERDGTSGRKRVLWDGRAQSLSWVTAPAFKIT